MSIDVVNILLATYNGAGYISEQLDSIVNQKGVRVKLFVLDDGSSDNTREIVASYSDRLEIEYVEKPADIQKGASASFLFLLRHAYRDEAEFFAFCDQDDIWHPEKLQRAIERIRLSHAQGYSSSVLAFWPSGKERVLDQSRRFTELDYLYEGAGQGCTYVLTRSLVHVALEAMEKTGRLWMQLGCHDWFVYAICRAQSMRWYIDDFLCLRYRQHSHNEIGAKASFSGLFRRVKLARAGWYARQIGLISDLLRQAGLERSVRTVRPARGFRRFVFPFVLMARGRRKISDSVALSLFAFLGYV